MTIRDDVLLQFLGALKKPSVLYKFWTFVKELQKWERYGDNKSKITIFDFVNNLSSMYQDIFKNIVELLNQNIPFSQLQKKVIVLIPPEAGEVKDTEAEELLIRLTEHIRDFFVGKLIIRVAETYTEVITREKLNISQVYKDIKFMNWLAEYEIGDMGDTFNPLDEDSITVMSELLKEENFKIETPFPNVLPYFETGRMYIFAGGSKAGKSILMVNLANYFAFDLGMPVLYFSIENKTTETLTRLITSRYNIGRDGVKDYFKKWIEELKAKKSAIIIERGLGMTAEDVLFYYNKYQDPRPQVIIIDYLDLLEHGGIKSENMFEKYAEISRRLFKIAQQTKTIMLVPTQLNREGVKKMTSGNGNEVEKLQTTNISRSWGKVEPADAIFLLAQSREFKNTVLLKLDMCRYALAPKHAFIPVDFSKAKYYFEKSLFNGNNSSFVSDISINEEENASEDEDLNFIE